MKRFSKKAGRQNNVEKVIRATFSLPASVIGEMEALRHKLAADGHILNRSELVRVGLVALESLPAKNAGKAIAEIERLKAGRPKIVDGD
jgi:hypothetical protein